MSNSHTGFPLPAVAIIALFVLTLGRSALGVGVTIVNAPAAAQPGQAVPLNVSYSKPTNVAEKRLVFILELRQLGSDIERGKWVLDNNQAGYTASAGTLTFPAVMPADAAGSYYFKATAVPWSLNRAIVSKYKSYPTNGAFTYLWSGGGYGVTQNVYYRGSLICPKPAGNTTYCSGLAFEACLVPYNEYNATYGHPTVGGLTVTQMGNFRRVWYGVTDAEKLAARAIPEYGLGVEITDFEEAQEGDFVQLWRHSGSGHNPLFVNWVRNGAGQITGVRYWGSQGSTNGIGYNTESFGVSSGMNRARFYLGRLRKPRDQADTDWALGQATTAAQPTGVFSAVADWADY